MSFSFAHRLHFPFRREVLLGSRGLSASQHPALRGENTLLWEDPGGLAYGAFQPLSAAGPESQDSDGPRPFSMPHTLRRTHKPDEERGRHLP